MQTLNAATLPLEGSHLIEASAGTGKTYNIVRIYLRLLLEKELTTDQILVMTFTVAATAEIRSRLNSFLRETLEQWDETKADPLIQSLKERVDSDKAKLLLQQAILQLDEAAIYTIHGFCKRALSQQAFFSGISFNANLEADTVLLKLKATQDWYRSIQQAPSFEDISDRWPTPEKFIEHWANVIDSDDTLNFPVVEDLAPEARGYRIHPSIEYKIVDGIGGMYAKDDINLYDVLYSGPGSVKSNWVGRNLSLDYLSDIIKEYKLGSKSEIYQMFKAFETIEFFKKYSIYFATDSEFETLHQISQSACVYAREYRDFLNNQFEWLRGKFDSDVTDDDILYILLNSETRAWGDGGFNPILDLFNHSGRKGNARMMISSDQRFVLGARVPYKKGEQIYDSYGQNDIYHFCAAYNFFDPSDYHCSNIVARLDIGAESEIQKLQLAEIKKSFNVVEKNVNGVSKYKILNKDLFLTEDGPNRNMVKAIDTISKTDVNTFDEPVRMNDYQTSFLLVFNEWLSLVESTTNPMSVDKSKITSRLESWYNAAMKELDLIKINRSWLLNTNLVMPNYGAQKIIENLENQK